MWIRRKLDYFEYKDIEKESLLENSDYKYSINDMTFHRYEDFTNGFQKLESPRYGLQIGKFIDTEMHFCLDLGICGIRKDLPECILNEIEYEANRLLEVNFVKPEFWLYKIYFQQSICFIFYFIQYTFRQIFPYSTNT